MGSPLKSPYPAADLVAWRDTALRLLERAAVEVGEPERPIARLAGERCLAHLAAAFEALAAAAQAPGRTRRDTLLDEAWNAVARARAALDLLRQQHAIAPGALRQIVAGTEVLRRRLESP